jgi:HK97 family phage major capsid protein
MRMPTTTQLVEQRNNTWSQMTELIDSAEAAGRPLSAEERQTYERLEKAFDDTDAEIELRKRHAKRGEENDRVDRTGVVSPAPGGGDDPDNRSEAEIYAEAFKIFVQNGMTELDREQRAALRSGFVKSDPKEIRAAQGIGTTTAGGYLVPEGFRQQIVERMKAYGAVQQVAQVLNTSTGAPLPWPTNDDTGNVGALLAENTAATEQDLTLGTAQLGAYKYTSKLVRVSLEFLQDVDWLDAEGFLRRKFAERLGRIHNQHFTTGTGTAQPQGIVTGATTGVTAASATAITADELIDLQHSVDPAYRNERSKFMLSDTALKGVRKLKAAGTGEYLFQVSTSADMPNLLAGSPYVVNQDMAVPATGVKSVLYGDFEAGYVIRLVKAFELIRLDERFAEFGQVGFIAFDRADGLVQDANAYKALAQL